MIDVLIIGAGPAGCVSASYLAEGGFKVTIIEKTIFPRFVIGESLLPSSMQHFEEANLLEPLLQQDFEIKKGVKFISGQDVFDISFNEGFTPG
jgi:2-polyprenyl-6-methoxyphenol hydroxylase-like FAD-dependent oxidoreductase